MVVVEDEVTATGLFERVFIFSSKSFLSKSGRGIFFIFCTLAVSVLDTSLISYDMGKKSPISMIVSSKITKKRNTNVIFFSLMLGL